MIAFHVRPSGADLIVIDLGPPGPRLSRSRRTDARARTQPPPLPTNKQECGVTVPYHHAQIWRGALSSNYFNRHQICYRYLYTGPVPEV